MKQGWEMKQLGDVCRFINGRAYSQHELLKEGKYPVLRVGNFYTNRDWYYSDLDLPEDKYCDKGDLLYAWSASFGPRIWDGEKVIYHYHIWKVEPNEKLIGKDFLFQLLEWDTEALKTAHGTGTTMMHVGKGSIEKKLIPLPPLPEQQRIVAILNEAFAAIAKAKANAEQNLKNAKELFESYLQGVFENKGEGWEEKKLGEVCELINRGVSPKYLEKNGVIVLNQKCIRDHKISFEQSRFHDGVAKKVSPEKMVKLGDVLINSTGTGTLGRVAQVREELDNVTVDSHVTIVRPLQNLFFIDFFGWALIFIEDEIAKRGEGCGGQTELARSTLKIDFSICFPKSLKAQQTFVQKLDALSNETKKLEIIYQQKINDLEELKKSVLQKAFSGELTSTSSVTKEIAIKV